jgi:predicted metalloprotease with PDZ domain
VNRIASDHLLPLVRLLAVASAFFFPAVAGATIRYEISLAAPEHHLFHVIMTIPDVHGSVTLQLPAWNALYQIRDFSAHVQELEARAGGAAAPLEALDKQTWIARGEGEISLRYLAYWDEPGPFGTQLSPEHAFINPAMILMYVPDRRAEDVSISLTDIPAGWRVASAILPGNVAVPEDARVSAAAAGYDALTDSPLEAGPFEMFRIPGLSPEIDVAVDGDHWKQAEVRDELQRICRYEEQLMGGAPFPHYLFLLHFGSAWAGAGGGMEHANSTAISAPSGNDLSNVAAHEFFHLWNVKRLRPQTLNPVDYQREQYTRALWFAEGVTSTYAAYTLVRTGLWSREEFLADLSDQITELENRPAVRWQSVEESSLNAWLEKYPLYNRPERSVSYYTKGQILGVLLDILIRDRTNNARSLDDVLRVMNEEFAKANKPYRDSLDVELAAERVAGGSFADFFRDDVAGTRPLPYDSVLALAGLQLRRLAEQHAAPGFEAARRFSGELVVASVEPGSAASAAGLRQGDRIPEWDGAAPPRSAAQWARTKKPGETLRLKVERDGRELTISFPLAAVTEYRYQVSEAPHTSSQARRLREGLLRGSTDHAAMPAAAGLR